MTKNMVQGWTKTQIVPNPIAIGTAGGSAGDPVRIAGLNGVNLWGTSLGRVLTPQFPQNGYNQGVGIPAGYCMLALNGSFRQSVNITTTAVVEGSPIYITAGNLLSNQSAGNTLYGYAIEPGAIGAATSVAVAVSNAI